MSGVTLEHCSDCDSALVAWPYWAADGDMLFVGGHDVLEGKGEFQKRAALICPKCDHLDRFPRRRALTP